MLHMAAGGAAPFARLQALLLGDNALADWDDVQSLAAFPALAEARLSGNPILRSAPGGGRYEARLALALTPTPSLYR